MKISKMFVFLLCALTVFFLSACDEDPLTGLPSTLAGTQPSSFATQGEDPSTTNTTSPEQDPTASTGQNPTTSTEQDPTASTEQNPTTSTEPDPTAPTDTGSTGQTPDVGIGEGGCDHSITDYEVIDLAAIYGACNESAATVSVCACGEYGKIKVFLTCIPTEDSKFNYYYTDENWVEHETYQQACRFCGLSFYKDDSTYRDDCISYSSSYATLSIGELQIAEKTYASEQTSHDVRSTVKMNGTSCTDGYTVSRKCADCGSSSDEQYYDTHELEFVERKDLLEFNTCGGYVDYYSCPCGEIKEHDVFHNCFIVRYVGDEPDFRDSDGVLHTIASGVCEVCNMQSIYDYYAYYDGCEVYLYCTASATIGNTVIYDDHTWLDEINTEHDYLATVQLNGDSCTDGFVRTAVCKRCGDIDVTSEDEHIRFLTEIVYLSDIGFCGGWYENYICPCELIDDWYIRLYCDNLATDYESEYDENGYERRVHTTTCADCDLLMIERYYTEIRDCTAYSYAEFSLCRGDTVVADRLKTLSSTEPHHTYETTYILRGASCTDGIDAVSECIHCGDRFTTEIYEHEMHDVTYIDTSEHGCCAGTIEVLQCSCKYESYVFYEITCDTEFSNSYYEDENMIYHAVSTVTCKDCGLVIVYDTFSIEEDGISVTYQRETVTTKDGEILVDITRPYN